MSLNGKYEQSKRLSCQSVPRGQREGEIQKLRTLWEVVGGNQKKKGVEMLAGEEERSCWQTQEESKNRAACKGCVYYTVYTWRKTPGEQTWSKRSCCHVDNTQTHSEKSGRTWSLLCQAVVTSDPLALQLEMMPARQLNVGQAKQTVCLNVFISVSVCLCVHRGVDPQWPITVVSKCMRQW